MTWLLFALLAVTLWGVSNLVDKYVFDNLDVPPIIGVYAGVVGIIAAIIFSIFIGFDTELPPNLMALGVISGFFFSAALYLYIAAIKHDDISKLVALFNFVPVYVAIMAAIFLGEIFSLQIYIGIFALVLGAVLISSDGTSKIKFTKGFWYIMCSALFFSIANVMDKYILEHTDIFTVFALVRTGFALTLIPYAAHAFSKIKDQYSKSPKSILLAAGSSVLGLFGFVSLYQAMKIGYVTLVEAMTAFQPLIVLVGTLLVAKIIPGIFDAEHSKDKIAVRLVAIFLLMVGGSVVAFT